MVDRLSELKRNVELEAVGVDTEANDRELAIGVYGNHHHEYMCQLFSDVEIVEANIFSIQEAAGKIADINQNVLQATTTSVSQDFLAKLEPSYIRGTKKNAVDAQRSLQALRAETKTLKANSSTSKQGNEVRIRENLLNMLTRKFMDVMKVAVEEIAMVLMCKADIKKNGKRHVQIVKPDATTEEIQAVFKSGVFFKSAIIMGGDAADLIRSAHWNFVESVSDKCKDVLLETSVAELHQIFLDLAQLAEREGDLTGQIELCWKEAHDYIDNSKEELVEAIVMQKSIRARQCCFFVIFLIVIGALVGGLTAKFA